MHRIFTASVASVYPLYVAKVERKGRTVAELDEVIGWLTGFDTAALQQWADVAPEYLTRGVEPLQVVGSKLEFIDGDGNLDADHVDALAVMLTDATSSPDDCHYALWQGWGWVRPGSMMIVGDDQDRVRSINDELSRAMAPVWDLAAACPVEPWWGGCGV